MLYQIFQTFLKNSSICNWITICNIFNLLGRFLKNHLTEHTWLRMIETCTKKNLSDNVGVIYVDLSKVFGSQYHDLLTAKLKCCGLDQHAVECSRMYLSNSYQWCKTNNTLVDWRRIIAGVPQGIYTRFSNVQ